ncbi:MAG TPA: RNA polymerase-associated protein RapA [Cellvibrionaceae bacterium]
MTQTVMVVGQRYVSDTEPELGLGVVLSVAEGRVSLGFPAAQERRTYAQEQAPLSRVRYQVGERIRHQSGEGLTVASVEEQAYCLLYQAVNDDGEARAVPEFELDSFVRFSKPRERLFSGQIDSSRNFSLRYQSQQLRHQVQQSPVYGLGGPRVSLLPHQMYIASSVAARHAPRVLLADEVGLGKTIEAGLILHQQLLTNRAHRALIVVPPSLLHQWLVEMLRRFNLSFTLLDEARCRSLEGRDSDDEDALELPDELEVSGLDEINPFESAQLVLCSLEFLTRHPERQQQAIDAGWDLLLVDEAHHLLWSPEQASDEYQAIEALAATARGLLLLTATPEQLGLESHFARLRLLDPDRYNAFDDFVAEQAGFGPLNDLVQTLLAEKPEDKRAGAIPVKVLNDLAATLDAETLTAAEARAQTSLAAAIDEIIDALLDRHGTGRVLMRNTRHGVKGFPRRLLEQHSLPLDDADAAELAEAELAVQLHPEEFWQSRGEWWLHDPRVTWLRELLKAKRGSKVLVICASGDTAQELELYLRLRGGISTAVFHEGLNLIARDRAAAYFADTEAGAQVLIASEIGSEGRNFQFAQDLVLFDLPQNPDLLEQRIGRLDRIGQTGDIHIHLPLYSASQPTAQQKLARWYHQGLNAFEQTSAIGHAAYTEFAERLQHELVATSSTELDKLVDETAVFAAELNAELQAGRDRLLELNACRPQVAQQVIDALAERDEQSALPAYLMRVLDSFNVEYERHSETSWVLHPGEHMRVDPFPGLPESGMTLTFEREQALSREDMHFITWEHPLVVGAQELIIDTEFGNTAVATLKLPPLKPGTLLVEAVFCLHCPAPKSLQLSRYLSQPLTRVLLDSNGKNLAHVLDADKLAKLLQKVPRASGQELVRHSRPQIGELLDKAEAIVAPSLTEHVKEAEQRLAHDLGAEVLRLKDLARVNPNVRIDEVEYLQEREKSSRHYLSHASLRLDAVRVIIAV